MKVNKWSGYIYGFLMMMPFLMVLFVMLAAVFTRNQVYTSGQGFIGDISGAFDSVYDTGYFDWVDGTPFYSSIKSFCNLFSLSEPFSYFLTYMIDISVVYLGIEVLLAFINIARKLVYAFVDKEF